MGCPEGGSHEWRNKDRRHIDGSTFQQCRKCLEVRENNPILKAIIIAIVIMALLYGLHKWNEHADSSNSQQNRIRTMSSQLENHSQIPQVLSLAMQKVSSQ